jgi:hypothetical protein
MRDVGWVRSIPLFTGGLTFVPACNGGGDVATDGDDTTTASSDSTMDATETFDTGSTDDGPPTTESTDDTADTGTQACGGEGTCGAAAPLGWFGPLVYARVEGGAIPPSCPAEVGDPGPTVVDGFIDPGPAVCECQCQPTMPLNCNAYLIQGDGYESESDSYGYTSYGFIVSGSDDGDDDGYGVTTGYGGTGDDFGGTGTGGYYGGTATGGYYGGTTDGGYYGESGYGGVCGGESDNVGETCVNLSIEGPVRFNVSSDYYYGYYGYGANMCEKTESEVFPMHSWAASIATCRIPEVAPACDDGVCLPEIPEGFENKWCIYQQGDLECPDSFPAKSTFWSDVEDTRSCSTCDCGAIASCDDADLMIYEAADCAGEPIAVLNDDSDCTEVSGASMIADFGGEECPVAQQSEPQGTIVATGEFTFCCSE